jgi:MarR family transcriptional regulator, transcriptional regulator for hemolysin
MPDLDERFANALLGAARAWRQAVDRRLKPLRVSQASWSALAAASSAALPFSQSELAQRLGVEGATMVAMVDRLVKAGLVERRPGKTDRRVNRVAVTDAGARLIDAVRAEATVARRKLLAGVDAKKLAVATEVLEGLIERE